MKIWSVSCTLAVVLLVSQAQTQRRGSRRFNNAQGSDLLEEEEESASSFRQKPKSPRLSGNGNRRRPTSEEKPLEPIQGFRRINSRPEKDASISDSSIRQQSNRRKGKQLNNEPRREINSRIFDSSSRSNASRLRGISNEENRKSFTSSPASISSRDNNSDVGNRTNNRRGTVRSRAQDSVKSYLMNENIPLFSTPSMSPEDDTFPTRSRSRQKESFTSTERKRLSIGDLSSVQDDLSTNSKYSYKQFQDENDPPESIKPHYKKEEGNLVTGLHSRMRGQIDSQLPKRGSYNFMFRETTEKSQIEVRNEENTNAFRSRSNNHSISRSFSLNKNLTHLTETVKEKSKRKSRFKTATQLSNSVSHEEQLSTTLSSRTVEDKGLPNPNKDLELSIKSTRGRGNVRSSGKQSNDKNPTRKADEEVNDDDNYPDVYKQLKRAGNGPKEILALLKARNKERDVKEARHRGQSPALSTLQSRNFSDLKSEEDILEYSIELPLQKRKQNKTSHSQEDQITSRKPLRSSYQQQERLAVDVDQKINHQNNEPKSESDGFRSLRKYEGDRKETKRSSTNKIYSAKISGNQLSNVEAKLEATEKSRKSMYKTLNDLGLDPNTLETTEPATERDRFIPSSRRTKPLEQSTEGTLKESQTSLTFKPRYQLYEAKQRKTLLEKRLGIITDSKENKTNESVQKDDPSKEGTKKVQFRPTLRPSLVTSQKLTTSVPQFRSSYRHSGKFYKRQPLVQLNTLDESVLETQSNDQEPITVRFIDIENKVLKLESASLVTEASLSTVEVMSSPSPLPSENASGTLTENILGTSKMDSSTTVSTTQSVVTDLPVNNFVLDDEVVNITPLPPTQSSSTIKYPGTLAPIPFTQKITSPTTQFQTTPSTTTPSTTTKVHSTVLTTQITKTATPKLMHTFPKIIPETSFSTQNFPTFTSPIITTQKPKLMLNETKRTTAKPVNLIKISTLQPTTMSNQYNPVTTIKTAQNSIVTQSSTNTLQKLPGNVSPTIHIDPRTSTTYPIKHSGTVSSITPDLATKTIITTAFITTTSRPITANQPPVTLNSSQENSFLFPSLPTTEILTPTSYQVAANPTLVEGLQLSPNSQLSVASTSYESTPKSKEAALAQNSADYVAYALLPNNTLVRRVSTRSTSATTEIPFVVYGLYPNGTVVKKYPNGTVVPDNPPPEANELVAEVDPLNKQRLSEILEQDRPLAFSFSSTPSALNMASSVFTTSSEAPTFTTQSTSKLLTSPQTSSIVTHTTSKNPTTTKTTPIPTASTKLSTPLKLTSTTIKPKFSTVKTINITIAPTIPTVTTEKPTTSKPLHLTTTMKLISAETTLRPKLIQSTTKSTSSPITTTSKRPISITKIPILTNWLTTASDDTSATNNPRSITKTISSTTPIQSTSLKTTSTPYTTTPTTTTIITTTNASVTIEEIPTREAEETILSSSTPVPAPTKSLSDDFSLLDNLLHSQNENSVESNSVTALASDRTSSTLPPTGPDDDDLANRIIQLAIERAQTSTRNPVQTEGLELQQLLSSPQPNFEREGKSIAPPLVDSMGVETSSPGGKISLWVVPDSEPDTKPTTATKLSPEEEQVLTALLAAPQPTGSVSLRDQLLLAELLAAGKNGANGGGYISTTSKRPRKKKRPSTTVPPASPTLSPLAALFGGGGGRGLFNSGGVPANRDEEESEYSRPQGGLLVNAAINITRAVSQFMGLVLQGAAQSFQSFLASRTRNFAEYLGRGGGGVS